MMAFKDQVINGTTELRRNSTALGALNKWIYFANIFGSVALALSSFFSIFEENNWILFVAGVGLLAQTSLLFLFVRAIVSKLELEADSVLLSLDN